MSATEVRFEVTDAAKVAVAATEDGFWTVNTYSFVAPNRDAVIEAAKDSAEGVVICAIDGEEEGTAGVDKRLSSTGTGDIDNCRSVVVDHQCIDCLACNSDQISVQIFTHVVGSRSTSDRGIISRQIERPESTASGVGGERVPYYHPPHRHC